MKTFVIIVFMVLMAYVVIILLNPDDTINLIKNRCSALEKRAERLEKVVFDDQWD
ncbi:MAG: hypothetical protein JSR93_03790 [Verrucomicrobia bacterium]|nr:hypothetical protein [Verrucomicrobiota bacterium]